MTVSNFDGNIAAIVEDKNLLGYNASNNYTATVNNELVQNIDPRTIPANAFYDSGVAAARGTNAAWDYTSTKSFSDTWTALKSDTRDLLGAVVEIKLNLSSRLQKRR